MLKLLFGDLWRYVPRGGHTHGVQRVLRFVATMLLHSGWHAVFNFRLAQMFYKLRLYPVGWLVYKWNMFLFGIDIAPRVQMGAGAWLPHPLGIVLARDSVIGKNATIYQNVTVGGRGRPPAIGDVVVLGAGACVLEDVVLGDNVRVGANAVVTKSFESDLTLVGSPAKPVQKHEESTGAEL
ncbi:MAG: serine O-acetyltransferase [Kiritimatiellae bacterium]|nr:serine O-acetyltransferase [Kiritimatiellia bacterium]